MGKRRQKAKQKTCAMCGRVGKRVFTRDSDGRVVCRNTQACVTRLCDRVFLDNKPKPLMMPPNPIFLRYHFYGVVSQGEIGEMTSATLEFAGEKLAEVLTHRMTLDA